MSAPLTFGRRAAASGPAKSLVVLLHGYGADGANLLGLADVLGPHLPGTAFVAPNAPDPCRGNPFGFQWFPIPWLDGASEAEAEAGLQHSAARLDAFLDDRLAAEGVPAGALALFGFSQGTMMALQVAPRRAEAVAGVVGFSGRLLAPERLAAETVSTPPVLLLHGDADEVVPFPSLALAADGLARQGFEVYTHVSQGMGHGIAPDGLSAALQFLRQVLPG